MVFLFNIRNRWNEWTDKRPLIGEQLFVELELIHFEE